MVWGIQNPHSRIWVMIWEIIDGLEMKNKECWDALDTKIKKINNFMCNHLDWYEITFDIYVCVW